MKTPAIKTTAIFVFWALIAIQATALGQKQQPVVKTYTPPPYDTTKGKVYTVVDKSPGFPGGGAKFSEFLRDNIVYPQAAKRKNVTGLALITLVIETDGSLTDMHIARDPGYGLGAEAIKVLKLSPKWEPGKKGGRNVRVLYTVPVNFGVVIKESTGKN